MAISTLTRNVGAVAENRSAAGDDQIPFALAVVMRFLPPLVQLFCPAIIVNTGDVQDRYATALQ